MVEEERLMEEDGIKFRTFKCPKCGEELMDMKQLNELAEKYRELKKAEKVKFSKWGNSIAVRIPKTLGKGLGIIPGKHALMLKEKDCLKILLR
ncbi:MAG: hypothetical protein AB1467_03160 [Candidatus Diapherotrites archaeon]